MTIDEVKEELNSYKNDWQLIQKIEEQLEYYNAKLTATTKELSATPKGTPLRDKMGEYIAKLEEIKEMNYEYLLELEAKTERTEKIIKQLKQPYQTLLHTTYIAKNEYENEEGVAKIVVGCKLRETAYLMTYDYKYLCKLHGRALIEYLKVRENDVSHETSKKR